MTPYFLGGALAVVMITGLTSIPVAICGGIGGVFVRSWWERRNQLKERDSQ